MSPTRRSGLRVLATVIALLALIGGALAAAAPGPPVVSENFTLLPCSPANTTISIEGCEEHKLVSLDRQINRLSADIYRRLSGASSRRAFAGAANRWLARRRATCRREAQANARGTLVPVVYVTCGVNQDRARIAVLARELHRLRSTG